MNDGYNSLSKDILRKSSRDFAIPNQKDLKTPHIQLHQQNLQGQHQRRHPGRIPLSRRKGNKEDTTNMRVYSVVHAGMRHNNNEGAERHWKRASKGHRNNKNVGKLVARLPRNSSKHENAILAERHAINNTIRRIVSGGMGREKQLRQVILPWMESKRRRSPTNQWSSRRECIPSPPRRNIRRGSRTWRNVI